MKEFNERNVLFETNKLNSRLDKIGFGIQPNNGTVYDKKYKRNLIKGFEKAVKYYNDYIRKIEKLEVK